MPYVRLIPNMPSTDLVNISSLIITVFGAIGAVVVPFYLSSKQPIFLRKVKKELFLDFLSTCHEQIEIITTYMHRLDTRIRKISLSIGTTYYILIIVRSLIWVERHLTGFPTLDKSIKKILTYYLSLLSVLNWGFF